MKTLHLDKFQEEINDRILERGSEYYLERRVAKEGSDGEWQFFSVEGSEPYKVRLKIEGNDVKDYECDCPYDMGPVCKHIAACLYSIKATKEKKRKSVAGEATPVNPHERRIISATQAAKGRYGYIDWRLPESWDKMPWKCLRMSSVGSRNMNWERKDASDFIPGN